MADIVSIHDTKPEVLGKGQTAYLVGPYWAVTTAGEPSLIEVQMFKLLEVLDQKTVVTKEEVKPQPLPAIEIAEPILPVEEEPKG